MNLESLYREEWRRVLATTVRLTGDFDLSEEAAQDAFVAALEQWPRDGAPANPYAWLVATARNRVVDQLRRRARFRDKQPDITQLAALQESEMDLSEAAMVDDQLRLIFTCCHPALAVDAQVALTLRTVCGLTTEEIARGFLVPVATMAQRLVRVKRKIRDARLPFAVPPKDRLAERLDGVMLVVYLVFTEGYAATSGKLWIRRQLCEEAIRLGRLLCELIPRNPELRALLASMLLHDSRARDLTKKLSHWKNRIANTGTPERSRKACRCWNRRCAKAPRAFTLCKQPSRRCTLVRDARRTPTGRRSRVCTPLCFRNSRRRWWN
jgi:RNA polymerase sigma-70 factor, ECF subfamily